VTNLTPTSLTLPPDAPHGLRVLETRDLVSDAYVLHLVRDDGAHVCLGRISIVQLATAYPGLPHIDVDWPAAFAALEATTPALAEKT